MSICTRKNSSIQPRSLFGFFLLDLHSLYCQILQTHRGLAHIAIAFLFTLSLIHCYYYSQLRLKSDDEDGDIFESERSFPSVFNTFVNQRCVKKIKTYLSLHSGSMLFSKFLKFLDTHAHKKNNKFEHYGEIKTLTIILYWSNHIIKMTRNVVFKLNYEIKMGVTSKILPKNHEIKIR